jgi:competence protein ComEC
MGQMNIYVLDVGQGDTTIIQTPAGKIVVIDAYIKEKVQEVFTKQLGDIKKIEALVITHPHADHFNAAELFIDKGYEIEKVILSPFWLKDGIGCYSYQSLINLLFINDIPVEFLSGYMRLYPDLGTNVGGTFSPGTIEQLYIELLGPSQSMIRDMHNSDDYNTNHLSIISKLIWDFSNDDSDGKKFSMVISADAQMENWAAFDREGMLNKCTILRAAHHGSKNGTQWERINHLNPNCTIISSDPNGKDKIPDLIGCSIFREYNIEKPVYLTKDTGTIKIEVKKTQTGFSCNLFSFKNQSTNSDDFLMSPVKLGGNNYRTDWNQLTQSKI